MSRLLYVTTYDKLVQDAESSWGEPERAFAQLFAELSRRGHSIIVKYLNALI